MKSRHPLSLAMAALFATAMFASEVLAELPKPTFEKDGIRCWHDVAYGTRADLPDEGAGYKGKVWLNDSLPWKRYHTHRSGQFMDVYAPAKGVDTNATIVMFLHGGSWSERYDKDSPPWDIMKRVVGAGGVFCTADYILQTDRSANPFGKTRSEATFANMLRDIDLAVTKLGEIASELGATSPRLAITGESAGGHLSLLYAYDQGNPDVNKLGLKHSPRVAKVVSIVGPTDFTAKEFIDLGKVSILGIKFSVPFFRTLMNRLMGLDDGASLETGLKEAAKWSPVQIVNTNCPPTAVAYGAAVGGVSDGIVHVKQMTDLEAALKAANVPCVMKKYPSLNHGEVTWKGAEWISQQLLHDTKVFGAPVRVDGVVAKGMAVAIEGKRLFVGAGTKLYAFDVSTPLKPVLLGELDGFDNLRQIRVRGDFVYVVSRETGLRIVDVSDPRKMRIRSRYDSVEFATGIEVVGSVAFLSERIYGVEAVDISDPDNPAHIAIRKTHESQSCRYRDGWLFSGEWGEGELSVFDARDMRSFRQVAKADLGGFGDGVELDGKYIYCSTGHDSKHRGASDAEAKGAGRGLDIFDISDPANPRHVSRTDFPVFKPRDNDYWTPRVANGWAFCCDSHNGLFAVDVNDPAKPKVVDRLCIPNPKKPDWPSGAISSLEVGEGCLYMTCYPGGLYVVPVEGVSPQARPTGEPPKNASYREPYATDANKFFVYKPEASGQARSVVIRGDVAYVAFGDAGLHVLRIAKDGGFEKLGELSGRHRVTDCCFAGDRLLVAEGLDGFALYELDGPASFREVARRPNAGPGGSVAFWCWVPDGDTMLLSSRCGPYSFFSLKDFAGKELLAYRAGACQWDRYPADAAIGGMYPILRPYKGVIWMEMSGGAVRVKDELAGVEDSGSTVEQRNGVVRFGDNFLCTVADGYEIYSPDGKPAVKWRRLGEVGKSGKGDFRAMPRTDGRFVLLTERSAKKASVWDFKDAENPKLLRSYRLSGNPDAGAFFEGRAIIPAGHQGLLLEKL